MKTIIAAFASDEAARQAADELRGLHKPGLDVETLAAFDAGDQVQPSTLVQRGVPEPRAQIYCEAVRRGAALLAVDADDADADSIARRLDDHGAFDLDAAEARWRQAGWAGYEEHAPLYDDDTIASERAAFQREQVEGGKPRAFVSERQDIPVRKIEGPIAPEAEFVEEELVVTTVREEPVVEQQARTESAEPPAEKFTPRR